ncbi:amidohydrolase family-domain-containing protein [Coniochaeta sp. 2T2.1]|nr:amidohydrolase family-domain-containing protein [Coniochaeta sp. 2T2.1]
MADDHHHPPPIRWSLLLPLAGVAFAFYLGLDDQVQSVISSLSPSLRQTYCYAGVKATTLDTNCFTVEDGKFHDVSARDAAHRVNEQPGYAYPGLWDGHGHLLQYGEFLHGVDLFGSETFEEVRRRLGVYLDEHPGVGGEEEWVRGVGWDQMALGGMPTADMLEEDERLKGLYIMLDRVDVHCIWVSRAVLNLLPEDIPDVPGGEIVRHPGMGVFCDNAMDVVMTVWPRPGPEKKKEFVRSAMKDLHSVGLVGMHDAGVMPDDLKLYEEMASSDEEGWSLRVYAMIECNERNSFCPDDVKKVELDNGMLSIRSVKLFADGALGSWGSAMLEPYSDRPETTGSLLVNASTLTALTRQWAGAGYQVNIHAIGDLANRLAVDAMEAALLDLCPKDSLLDCQLASHRFRIEHAQIIHPDDQDRMFALGVTPSIQPTHATSDSAYAGLRLGEERVKKEAYRMRSVWGLNPVLGSDFPVEPANPFAGIYAAVTRRKPDTGNAGPPGSEGGGWCEEEALSLEQALQGFTVAPARGAFMEDVAGRIEKGMWADWVVLDERLEDLDVDELRRVRVRETWVGGRRVYKRDD